MTANSSASGSVVSDVRAAEPPLHLPHYHKPGVVVADPKYHKPLFKLMNSMFKMRRLPRKRLTRPLKKRKKSRVM